MVCNFKAPLLSDAPMTGYIPGARKLQRVSERFRIPSRTSGPLNGLCLKRAFRRDCVHAGELLIMRHTHEVRLVNAPAIVGESVLLNLLPAEEHVRPITLRAIAPCVLWVLTLKDLEHIFQVLPLPHPNMC